ncbi:ferredoxin [Streptomyces xanthochromogenes]|uniref:ferredoxin n=1 Tax=Streptomyces xanthochromogenes TaxID=67384 RepID=UPI0014205DD6|nr:MULTISPECIES: ferredoxin [Streptomyces]GHB75548.1 ferredoxin [Streptomyces xanthochromogenes]
MAYVIAAPCVDVLDRACIDECPVDCIYEGGRKLYIHPDECVDCGACEPVCPVEAIFHDDDLPGDWSAFRTADREVFVQLGSPGGSGARCEPVPDHPFVAELPTRTALSASPSARSQES